MLHLLETLARLGVTASLAATTIALGSGAVIAAVIAGVFMLANTVLTVYLTARLTQTRDREREHAPSPKTRGRARARRRGR